MKAQKKVNVGEVMAAAKRAFAGYQNADFAYRKQLLTRLQKVVIARQDEIVRTVHLETGKNEAEALMTEVFPVLDALKYYAKNLEKFLGARKVRLPLPFFGMRARREFRPAGVALIIAPWNFPFQLAMLPIISAVAAGNAAVLKPSPYAIKTGELCAELCLAARFPKGLVQVAKGDAEVGEALIAAEPARIFFTGSTAVGKIIAVSAAQRLIPALLELGGKTPFIVFADAPMPRAINAAVFGTFLNAGQVCVAASRLYVAAEVYDEFVAGVVEKTKAIPAQDLGKIVQPMHIDFLKSLIDDAVAKGAKIMCGEIGKAGFAPVVLADCNMKMRVMNEEIFGPVMPIMKFDGTVRKAVALANDSEYGLSAAIFTKSVKKAEKVVGKIKAGNININDIIQSVGAASLVFGGVKNSGFGRYHGKEGLRFFCDEVAVAKSSGALPDFALSFPYGKKFYKDIKVVMKGLYGGGSRTKLLKSAASLFLRNFR